MKNKDKPDNIIRVDHSIRPSYPGWVKMVVHPELENTGPVEYDILKVEWWLIERQMYFHKSQKGSASIEHDEGTRIYTYLREMDMLKFCLGLLDLEEIQKKGIAFFGKYFQKNDILHVFGWKSISMDFEGNLCVPFLYGYRSVDIMWAWMGSTFGLHIPVLRF